MNNSQHLHRILITTGIFPPDIGGPASYAETLASALTEQGVSVCVLTYSKSFRAKSHKYDFKVIPVWGRWPIWVKHLIFGVKLLGLASKFDTIYALNVWSAGFPSLLVSKICRNKFIIRIVGDYAWEVEMGKGKVKLMIDDFQKAKKGGWIETLYKLQGWVCKSADLIIVPSEYLAKLVKGWGVEDDKIKIIYNGVNINPLDISKEEAKKKLDVTGNIILSVGRLVPWKGFRMLIKLMPKLAGINQFFKLIIVGDGPDRRILEKMVKNLGLEKRVQLADGRNKEEIILFLMSSDLFILNSGYEGFSHQILEAMSVGTPVITTTSGGNREIIHQGENGFMVKYNDEFNIIEAVRTLWHNPDLRNSFIEKGRETAKHFSVDAMVDQTKKILFP